MHPASSTTRTDSTDARKAGFWLLLCLLTGAALVAAYPDSYQQDGGHHFLFARWAWVHPELFVSVWQRPLFSLFHAVPALAGYEAARLFSALLSTAGAWFTWQVARRLGIECPWRVIPFYLLQPALFLMWSDTMTEPLFATVLSAALWCHVTGRRLAGALLASLLIGARPEGAFAALVWGCMMLGSKDDGPTLFRRAVRSLVLATGLTLWILAAWLITKDPLFIKNNWPPDWVAGGAAYGRGPVWEYVVLLPEIAGYVLCVPVVIGFWRMARTPGQRLAATLFLFTFFVHTLMRVFGWFGAAGYARYFSSFAPCIALAGAVGWNLLATRWPIMARPFVWPVVAACSFVMNLWFVDGAVWNRDARGVHSVRDWFHRNHPELPVRRFVWSQAAMAIAFDRDPWEKPGFSFQDRSASLAMLRDMQSGTLVCWDAHTGKALANLEAEDFLAAGFQPLHQESHVLSGHLPDLVIFGRGGVRHQTFYLLYKP